jgi:hypothetical protein
MNTYFIHVLIVSFFILLFLHIYYCLFATKESFMPKIILETYRPLERNIRNNIGGFYHRTTSHILHFMKKKGIIV